MQRKTPSKSYKLFHPIFYVDLNIYNQKCKMQLIKYSKQQTDNKS